MATQNIENFLPPIQSDGLNTQKNTSLGGTLSVTGATTLTGAATLQSDLTVSGNETLSGNFTVLGGATFSGTTTSLVNVVSKTTNATLTAGESGSTILFNSATGCTLTLPASSVGLNYNFVVLKGAASGNHKVITPASSFIVGSVNSNSVTTGTGVMYFADQTATVALTMNGTTSGGTTGTAFRLTCITSTIWEVEGQTGGSGVLVTPFTTS